MLRPGARIVGGLGCLVVITSLAATAGAAPKAADLAISIGASTGLSTTGPTLTPNGGTATVTSRDFGVYLQVSLVAPGADARVAAKARVTLGEGLRWGSDDPDASEACTSTPTTGECQTRVLRQDTSERSDSWGWNVVAAANGTYTFSGQIVEASDSDPDAANNTASITIVVTESAGGAGGGGGGGGASAAVTASAVKISPAKPKAGSTAVASVRVTQGGSPLRPTRITCAASIGKVKLKGASRASRGVASCLFRTPTNAKGKSLRGSVSFRAGGSSFTKRFAVRLG